MDELVEGVLPVGPWLAPSHRTSLVVHVLPAPSDIFPVRLHVTLLEVGSEAMHVL